MEDKKQDDEKEKKVPEMSFKDFTEEKKPRIRFAGFTDDWQQCKLKDLAEFNPKSVLPDEFEYVDLESVVGTEMISHRTETKETAPLRAQRLAQTGDLFYQTVRPYQKNNYLYEMPEDNYVFSTGYAQMRPYGCGRFLLSLVQTDSFVNTVLEHCTGTSYPAINSNDLSNIEVYSTSDKAEQKQIGDFFKNLDNLITLNQRKCDELKKVKKYMLQKMFPKNGETKPEIRFAGFTDDWQQRKLGEVLEIVNNKNGNSYSKEEVLSVSDEYGCINQIRFQGRSFAGEDISNYKIVETGDIIYTRSPLKSKPYGIIKIVEDETGIVSPLYIVNKTKPGNDSEFIYRVFDSPEKTNSYLGPLVRKGAKNTMNISNSEWLSGEIIVSPFYEEQHKIGLFFKQLDNLITLHQRKCDELKKVKKYMLQNMFPRMS